MAKGFQKGNLHGKGRPVGSKNFATLEKRGLIDYLKNEGADKFIQELHTLEGKEFCSAYIPVIEIAFPKQSRVDMDVKSDGQKIEGFNYIVPDDTDPKTDKETT